jgi:DNA-binding transcriptional LysR family regulator
MFELRHLRHALALGRYRNYARAAEALHLTQPSLSRSISTLERELGVLLFDRSKNGVRPTAFGELLLQRGAALLKGEADFRREIQLLAGLDAGTLCIGTGPFPAEISVGAAAGRLLRAHPRLKVEVLCADPGEISLRVLAGQFDVGIGDPRAIAETPRLRYEPLPTHRAYLACRPGHPLAGRDDLALDDVLRYPLASTVLPGAQGAAASRGSVAGRLDEASGVFMPAVHVNSLSLARRITCESDALFPATAEMLAPDLAAGNLVTLDFQLPEMQTEYGLITLAERSLAPATVAFLDQLRSVEAEIATREATTSTVRKSAVKRPSRRVRSGA